MIPILFLENSVSKNNRTIVYYHINETYIHISYYQYIQIEIKFITQV